MRKDTRMIIGICILFLLAAGFLFVRQQQGAGSMAEELVLADGQEISADYGGGAGTGTLQDSTDTADDGAEECAVYVSGAVKRPGLYRYRGTARVSDAVEASGGFLKSADRDAVNLARILTDGEQICILTKKETAKKKQESPATGDTKAAKEHLININEASLDELMTLPGIGEAKAGLVIEYRTRQGPFSKKEDLMKISGIKEGVYNKIKDLISV